MAKSFIIVKSQNSRTLFNLTEGKSGFVFLKKNPFLELKTQVKYSFETEKEERLTFDSRAFNPVFIDKDSTIAYLATYDGGQDIFILDLKTMQSKKMSNLTDRPILSHLNYDKSSYSLFFDITSHHYRNIGYFDLKTEEIGFDKNNPHFDERNMSISEDEVQIFSQDKSGIYNLFMVNPIDTTSEYITNITG